MRSHALAHRPRRWQFVLLLVAVSWALLFTFVVPPFHSAPASSAGSPSVGLQDGAAWRRTIDRMPPVQALQYVPDEQPARPRALRWVDTSGSANLSDARARLLEGAFQPVPIPRVDGFTRHAYWYVMHLRRTDAAQPRWLLAVGQPYLDDVQVHVERADGALQSYQMGDRHISHSRPIHARWHVIGMNLALQEEVVVWVRVASGGLLNVDMKIDTPGNYFANELSTSAVLGAYMGVLLVTVFTYLMVGLWLRDGLLLGYGAFVASLFMLYMGQNGLLIQLSGTPPWWLSDLFAGMGSLGPWYAGNLMWAHALGLPKHSPRLNALYTGVAIVCFMSLPLVFTPYYGTLSQVSFLLGVCGVPLTVGLTWLAWRRENDRLSLVYLVAMLVYLVGVYTTMLYIVKVLPTNALTVTTQPFCTLLHTLIMGLALAIRIARISHDKAEAEQRAEAHRRFVAMLTHEFRNPLASIDRSANLIQAMRDRRNGPEQTRVSNIRQQARRLNTLVDSFLLVRDDGALPTQPQPTTVQLRPWLESLCQGLGPEMAARLVMDLPPPQAEAVLDPKLMQLALNNLLDNALRYSPDGAKVHLQARTLPQGGCELSVTDHGPGLDDAGLARLGQPYHRGENASGSQGTGLGYYFCKQIVEAHGGHIKPTRVQPQGLCVTLTLP